MAAIPVALEHDSIYECVFETRFGPGTPSTAELMPGMLFASLRKDLTASYALPFYQVPLALRESDPNFRYQPTHILQGPGIRLLVGPRVIAVSFLRPYPGWGAVVPRITECMQAALATGFMGSPERCSIKYLNLLIGDTPQRDLRKLRLNLQLAEFTLQVPGVSVRAEVQLNGCINVIEIVGKAKLSIANVLPSGEAEGLLLAVDTIKNGPFGSFSHELPQLLETMHATEKQVFFGLLTEETLGSMGPKYSGEH
jgi:uncharacterized protein (TIGR04255 family)